MGTDYVLEKLPDVSGPGLMEDKGAQDNVFLGHFACASLGEVVLERSTCKMDMMGRN